MNGIILKKERLEVLDLNVYNKPKIIYIPVIGNSTTILVKKGDYVFKGSIVYKRRDFQIPVFSSISGKIIDIIETSNSDNQKYIIIKNDFKEKLEKGIEKTNEKINKEMFLKLLKGNGITESGNPVYQKYNTDKKINTKIFLHYIFINFHFQYYFIFFYKIITKKLHHYYFLLTYIPLCVFMFTLNILIKKTIA